MSSYAKKTKSELQGQSRYAISTAQDALASNAWLYPLKGIAYFASHRACWAPFLKALPPALALSVGVLGFMFFFTYLPQAAFLRWEMGDKSKSWTSLADMSMLSRLSIINFGPLGAFHV